MGNKAKKNSSKNGSSTIKKTKQKQKVAIKKIPKNKNLGCKNKAKKNSSKNGSSTIKKTKQKQKVAIKKIPKNKKLGCKNESWKWVGQAVANTQKIYTEFQMQMLRYKMMKQLNNCKVRVERTQLQTVPNAKKITCKPCRVNVVRLSQKTIEQHTRPRPRTSSPKPQSITSLSLPPPTPAAITTKKRPRVRLARIAQLPPILPLIPQAKPHKRPQSVDISNVGSIKKRARGRPKLSSSSAVPSLISQQTEPHKRPQGVEITDVNIFKRRGYLRVESVLPESTHNRPPTLNYNLTLSCSYLMQQNNAYWRDPYNLMFATPKVTMFPNQDTVPPVASVPPVEFVFVDGALQPAPMKQVDAPIPEIEAAKEEEEAPIEEITTTTENVSICESDQM